MVGVVLDKDNDCWVSLSTDVNEKFNCWCKKAVAQIPSVVLVFWWYQGTVCVEILTAVQV